MYSLNCLFAHSLHNILVLFNSSGYQSPTTPPNTLMTCSKFLKTLMQRQYNLSSKHNSILQKPILVLQVFFHLHLPNLLGIHTLILRIVKQYYSLFKHFFNERIHFSFIMNFLCLSPIHYGYQINNKIQVQYLI